MQFDSYNSISKKLGVSLLRGIFFDLIVYLFIYCYGTVSANEFFMLCKNFEDSVKFGKPEKIKKWNKKFWAFLGQTVRIFKSYHALKKVFCQCCVCWCHLCVTASKMNVKYSLHSSVPLRLRWKDQARDRKILYFWKIKYCIECYSKTMVYVKHETLSSRPKVENVKIIKIVESNQHVST